MRELTYFPLLERYQMTSPYGYRTDPITGAQGKFHRGVDYGAPYGAPLIAPFDGAVTTGFESGGAGNWSWVVNGPDMFKSFHHSAAAVPGGWVSAGTVIAYIDSTGSSTGSHAHLELWDHGTNIDPTGYLDRAPLFQEDDEMTDEDFNRIFNGVGVIIDNRIDQFLTPRQLWQEGQNVWEAVIVNGERKRRRLRPGEVFLLRCGSELSEQPFVDVATLGDTYRDAFYAWPEC